PLLTSLLGFDAPASWAQSLNVLVQLAASMRAHGRGGALLVVPSGTDTWRQSIVQPILYGVQPFFSELTDLLNEQATERRRWQEGRFTVFAWSPCESTVHAHRVEALLL